MTGVCKEVQGSEFRVKEDSESPNSEHGTLKSDCGILDIPVVCIGPTTALAAEEAGFTEIYFPDEYTAEGMVDELLVISGKLGKRYPSRK
jgi:hypothetical protein